LQRGGFEEKSAPPQAQETQGHLPLHVLQACTPLSSKFGTHETVKARFWRWLSGESHFNF
jgi:hypothetical protein